MVKEDYVSFEIAKLLKEKGFNWCESPFCSEQDRDEWRQNNSYTVPNEEYNPELPFDSETLTMVAPHVSLQMVMKWLRETHKISVEPLPDWLDSNHENIHDGWYCEIRSLTDMSYNADYFEHKKYNTYEEACEAAIKYCLENLI